MKSDKQLNCLKKGRQTEEASLLAILTKPSCFNLRIRNESKQVQVCCASHCLSPRR